MTEWEYAVEPYGDDDDSEALMKDMDEWGHEGWEAFATAPGHTGEGFRILYKRQVAKCDLCGARYDKPHRSHCLASKVS